MTKEWTPETIFDVLGSERARRILALASVEPVSADDIEECCDMSMPTVYRRVNALLEYDLLDEETRIDEDGNHYRTFGTSLERVCFEVDEGEFDVDVELDRDMVDRFEEFWGDLERSARSDEPTPDP